MSQVSGTGRVPHPSRLFAKGGPFCFNAALVAHNGNLSAHLSARELRSMNVHVGIAIVDRFKNLRQIARLDPLAVDHHIRSTQSIGKRPGIRAVIRADHMGRRGGGTTQKYHHSAIRFCCSQVYVRLHSRSREVAVAQRKADGVVIIDGSRESAATARDVRWDLFAWPQSPSQVDWRGRDDQSAGQQRT